MKKTNRNKLKGAATLTLAAALFVTGSLAWQDVSQHKTNKFATKSVAHSMVLVEDFDPVEGWTLGQEVKKEVSVRNGQEIDDTTRFAYTDGYVRLQIREFMGIAAQTYVTHPNRLMIQTNGDFYRYEVEQDALDKADDLKISQSRVVKVQGINDDKTYFYIQSAAGDANGQYGKFLITDITTGDIKSIVDDSVVADLDKDVTDKHNSTDGSNKEDSTVFTTHLWAEGQDNFTPAANKFTEYVKWTLGTDVITLQQWKDNYHSKPVAKWIVDTSDVNNGFVYWGQRLDHATNANERSLTSKLLEKVTLIKQPQGHAEYRVHVNMDAVSYDDLGKWTNGNTEIMDAFKNNVELADLLAELQKAIDRGKASDVSGMSADTIQALNDTVQVGKDVLTAGGPTPQDVKDAIKGINDAIIGLEVSNKVKIEKLLPVTKADNNYLEKYFVNVDKWDTLDNAITNAEDILLNNAATESQYEMEFNQLTNAYENIKEGKGIGKLGEKVYFADRIFSFVKENSNDNQALILSDKLSKGELDDLGLLNQTNSAGKVMYTPKSLFGTYLGYIRSYVKVVDTNFYKTYVKNHSDNSKVLPVVLKEENMIKNLKDTIKREDSPTLVSDLGNKVAFSLNISDFNYEGNGSKITNELISVDNFWLRGPSFNEDGASMFSKQQGGVGTDLITGYHDIRPALWVEMPSITTQP